MLYYSTGDDFDTSTKISEFETIKTIGINMYFKIKGEGGFGKVLLCRHKVTNINVKILKLNLVCCKNSKYFWLRIC